MSSSAVPEKVSFRKANVAKEPQVYSSHALADTRVPETKATAPRTIDELVRQRAQENPDQATISYPSSGIDYVDYTVREIDYFAFRAAQQYKLQMPQRESSSESETVVALLGPSNFDYFITILALTKLGHTVLNLSTRLSVSAYTSLMQAANASHIIVEKSFRDRVPGIKEELPSVNGHQFVARDVYAHDVPSEHVDTGMCYHLTPEVETKKIAWIMHSSGSTGTPKPIFIRHHAGLSTYSSLPISKTVLITFPLFHTAGLNLFFCSLFTRSHAYHLNADLPLTRENLTSIIQKYKFKGFYGVPYTLKLISESPESIAALATCEQVMSSGAPCPEALGNKLVESGVKLFSNYGR